MTIENQFADLTNEEFVEKIGKGAVVPESVMEDKKTLFSVRKERVPRIDRVNNDIPAFKNWFEEGMISVPSDQFALQCASSWAFSTVATLEALQAINGI